MSRKENEAEIKKLKDQIFEIEEKTLEPARRSLELAEAARDIAVSSVTVLGQTRLQWDAIQNGADLARINTAKFAGEVIAALSVVTALKTAYEALGKVDITKPPATLPTMPSAIVAPPGTPATTTLPDSGSGTAVPGSPGPGWTWDDDRGGWKPPASAEGTSVIATADSTPKTAAQLKIDQINADILKTRERVTSGDYWNDEQRDRLIKMNIERIKDVRALGGVAAAKGGLIPKMLSRGGLLQKFAAGGFAEGTDTVPAMLTPGEFVVRKYAVDNFGVDKLSAINNGTYSGESVYNYSVNVNVRSDANPDQIARAVMGQIKQIDSQRIRGNRF